MDFQSFKNVWQRQPLPQPAPLETARLLEGIEQRMVRFDRTIFWRDLRETLAALLLTAVFGFLAVAVEGAWAVTGAWIGAVGSLSVAVIMLTVQHRHRLPEPSMPVTSYLRGQRAKVAAQIRLLETVIWWYFAPPAVGMSLVMIGALLEIPGGLGPRVAIGAVMLSILLVTAWGFVALNRWVVRAHLAPLQRSLDRSILELADDLG